MCRVLEFDLSKTRFNLHQNGNSYLKSVCSHNYCRKQGIVGCKCHMEIPVCSYLSKAVEIDTPRMTELNTSIRIM